MLRLAGWPGSRVRPRWVLVAALSALVGVGGCGGAQTPAVKGAASTTAPVTAVRSDVWTPPVVAGPPSTVKFCVLLVADYTHLKTNSIAVTMRVRQQIIGDYVRFTPTVIAAAPPQIAPAAMLYLQSIAKVLDVLNSVGLDSAKAPPGQIGSLLSDPAVQAASIQVLDFSQQYCHYDITSVT